MPEDRLTQMLEFLSFCNERNVHYHLEQYADDAVTATLTLVGARVEVSFSSEGIDYSLFTGDESVLSDVGALKALIDQRTK